MTGEEANDAVAQVLMDKVRQDTYPSVTHMKMLETMLPQERMPEYLEILLDKVADEPYPSIPMLQRVQRIADSI